MRITTLDASGERILSIRIDEPALSLELITSIHAAVEEAEGAAPRTLVFLFDGGAAPMTGDFTSWQADAARDDMRYFARWEDLLAAVSRLQAKTFAAYRGCIGQAAVELGFVVDLRLAAPGARLHIGGLAGGRFPGAASYWLPKFVGLGVARRLLLLGGELDAEEAARIGLLDIVDKDLEARIEGAALALRSVSPEAACFVRRILDESYWHERAAALEQIKAARYKFAL